jgi:hypothetical protein
MFVVMVKKGIRSDFVTFDLVVTCVRTFLFLIALKAEASLVPIQRRWQERCVGLQKEMASHCYNTVYSNYTFGNFPLEMLLVGDSVNVSFCNWQPLWWDLRHSVGPWSFVFWDSDFFTHLLYIICRVCYKCIYSISTRSWMSYAQWHNSCRFFWSLKYHFNACIGVLLRSVRWS